MLSRKANYGLRAVIHLAEEHGHGPVLIADLSAKQKIPKKFLEQILLDLKNQGILQSKSGKGGGYYLSRSPDTLTFGQVIRSIDGPAGAFGLDEVSQSTIGGSHTDGAIHIVMADLRNAISNVLDRTTIESALQRSKAAALKAADTPTYEI
jgi:Rrf2 family protein